MELDILSSDDLIDAYKRQLADAHDRIALLSAQVAKAQRLGEQMEQEMALREYTPPETHERTQVSA